MTAARNHILVMTLAMLALCGCGTVVREVRKQTAGYVAPPPSDMARARIAWSYFAANDRVETVAGSGFTTPSAIGDDLAASIAAFRIGLIKRPEFDRHVRRTLGLLDQAQLSGGILPGRFHAAATGRLIDPPNAADPGWSSVEIGRLLAWLRILAESQPRHTAGVDAIVGKWQLCRAIDAEGRLLRALPNGKGLAESIDSGSGYAGYAALGFRSWGIDARVARVPGSDFSVRVEGVDLPLDPGGQSEPLLTVPLALIAMEYGWRSPDGTVLADDRRLAALVVDVQKRRSVAGGILTARSDFRRPTMPFVVRDTVLGGGFPWSTLDEAGTAHPGLALFSTRAAFALRALQRSDGDSVVVAADAMQRDGGWIEGRYENGAGDETTQSAATNAFILESILYRQAGTLHPVIVVPLRATKCADPGTVGTQP